MLWHLKQSLLSPFPFPCSLDLVRSHPDLIRCVTESVVKRSKYYRMTCWVLRQEEYHRRRHGEYLQYPPQYLLQYLQYRHAGL